MHKNEIRCQRLFTKEITSCITHSDTSSVTGAIALCFIRYCVKGDAYAYKFDDQRIVPEADTAVV